MWMKHCNLSNEPNLLFDQYPCECRFPVILQMDFSAFLHVVFNFAERNINKYALTYASFCRYPQDKQNHCDTDDDLEKKEKNIII